MGRGISKQLDLFQGGQSHEGPVNDSGRTVIYNASPQFPSTRYQGSKWKLIPWIMRILQDLKFHTCLDAFGGTGVVGFHLKKMGKRVTYNDILRFNYLSGLALIENSKEILTDSDVEWILSKHRDHKYPSFVEENFNGIYFTEEENRWIDMVIGNINNLSNPFKYALAFFALCQACIIKRPYNLFHRKNLYVRFADVKRSFGNKVTWDKSFESWFRIFVDEANHAVFDNGHNNKAINKSATAIPNEYDLVYIDTPYISAKGVPIDYLDFYHFLEGLSLYDSWDLYIDRASKNLRFKKRENEWCDKRQIAAAFDRLFKHFKDSILAVSYRNDGIPTCFELVSIMQRYKKKVELHEFGQYKYALSTNANSQEVLIIGT